jgi:16S rRNA (uracil1498-N3)-methyltransferase
MEIFYSPDCDSHQINLPDLEAHHALHVLRYKLGDEIFVMNGMGKLVKGKICLQTKKSCVVEKISERFLTPATNVFSIAIAPTKNRDRLEWFLEKATELGVRKVFLIKTKYTEKQNISFDRCERVIISAMKQSCNYYKPELIDIQPFEKVVKLKIAQQKFICHNLIEATPQLIKVAKPSSNSIILIGPEGGFDDTEIKLAIDNDFKCVLLGNQRLRTETAGVTAAALLQQINLLD